MIKAKLFVQGTERELLWTDVEYNRFLNHKTGRCGEIPMGGLVTLAFASGDDDDRLLRWMTHSPEGEFCTLTECKIVFYESDFDDVTLFEHKYNDTALVYWKEEFNSVGEQPMTITMTISAAIQEVKGITLVKPWQESWVFPSEQMPYQSAEVEEVLKPEIIKGWWSYDQNGEEVYQFNKEENKLSLGETVYFHVETKDIIAGEQIELQLYDYDYFWWMGEEIDEYNADTSKFPNDPVKKTATVRALNGKSIATIKLLLDERWEPIIHDDHDDAFSFDQTVELYWKASHTSNNGDTIKKELPRSKNDYLRVGYNDRTLYFKPAIVGHNLPEFISHDGSPLLFMKSATQKIVKGRIKAKTALKDKIVAGVNKTIDKTISNIALAKLERGNIVANTSKVYANPKARIYTKNLYTNDGEVLLKDVKIRKNFGFKQGDNITTTKGLSQYDYFSQSGSKVKILGLLKQIGNTISFFDLFKFGMDDEEAGTNPLSIQGIAGLGGLGATIALAFDVAGILMQPVKAEWDEALDIAIEKELEIAKTKGLQAVKNWVFSYGKKLKYDLKPVYTDTADKMLQGDFNTMDEIDTYNNQESSQISLVTILYKLIEKETKNIFVIETFFYNEN